MQENAPHKSSHQLRALFLKNLSLQSRQPCTNLCQIFTPVICLVFTVLIRNIVIAKIPDKNDSLYTKNSTIPLKLANYTLEDMFPSFVRRSCDQWLVFYVDQKSDESFVGRKNGTEGTDSGLLAKIKNTYSRECRYNFSLVEANYQYLRPPVFRNFSKSIDQYIYDTTLLLANESYQDYKRYNDTDKMPDGAIKFRNANYHHLNADLKVIDIKALDYYRGDGIAKIYYYSNKKHKMTAFYTISEGLLTIQHMLSSAYIQQISSKTTESGIFFMPPDSQNSVFVEILINTVTTVLFPVSLSLLLPVFLYLFVLQKQEKLIQMMRMNGLKMKYYWLVNFLFNLFMSVCTNFVFLLVGYFALDNSFFHQTGWDVLIVVLLGWMLAQIGTATLLQVFIASSQAANIIGYLVSIWTNLIGAILSIAIYQYPRTMPFGITLYPTFAFNRIFYLMFTMCTDGRCYSSLSSISQEMKQCIAILYVSFLVFQTIGMYLFEVVPQQYGVSQPLLFPFDCLTKRAPRTPQRNTFEQTIQEGSGDIYDELQEDQSTLQNNDDLAKRQRLKLHQLIESSNHALVVDRLTKVYANDKTAVSSMDLVVEDYEVFGLLGPNGAGKTTLISMITGVHPPTSGECTVAGFSIREEIEKVHTSIGVCPQFDILWPELTVEEHLYFYSRLRGTPRKEEAESVKQTLKEVNLQEFKDLRTNQLSGGMRRRLSVGISMVGNPRIAFLDEPTTGLDPDNRRNMWEVLSNCKNKRALFLTTHLMEEADALCTRVGIITDGVLRTVGTQSQLKRKYGRGQYLSLNLEIQSRNKHSFHSLVSDDQAADVSIISEDLHPTRVDEDKSHNFCSRLDIKNQIKNIFPESFLDRQINGYLRFGLGDMQVSSILMAIRDCQVPEIRDNWGLSNSSLEDVFFEVIKRFQSAEEGKPKPEENMIWSGFDQRVSIQGEDDQSK